MIIKTRAERLGRHVHCTFFTGRDKDHLQCAGKLVFDSDQWELLRGVSEDIPGVTYFHEGYITMGKDGYVVES